jgi:hypothetical protein
MSNRYEDDILLWAEAQAGLRRRIAAGKQINDQVDWPNVIDEIESVANEQLHAVESLLVHAIRHMLKAHCWPLSREVPDWEAEARVARGDAVDRFAPSMRHRIDMQRIYRRAMQGLPDTTDGQPPLPVPTNLPTLDELLADEP